MITRFDFFGSVILRWHLLKLNVGHPAFIEASVLGFRQQYATLTVQMRTGVTSYVLFI